MARKKTAADEIYNARRRAKRLLARLERDTAGQSTLQKRAQADYISQVKKQIEATYTRGRKGTTIEQARETATKLDALTKNQRKKKTKNARSNAFFQKQINLARTGNPSALGNRGDRSVSVFYAATRKYWQGKDPRNRNEIIMKALGVDSLEEAYKKVLSENKEALRKAMQDKKPGAQIDGLTLENEDFYNEVDIDPELLGSADWVALLKW